MLPKIKIDNLVNIMKNLNFKNNTDEYNDINRKLDNLLLKYIKNDINDACKIIINQLQS